MEQVRIFTANSDPEGLEKSINEWLRSMWGKMEVLQRSVVATPQSGQRVTIVYHYRLFNVDAPPSEPLFEMG